MAMGDSSLQADSKVKFVVWPTSCPDMALTDFCTEEPKWILAYGWRRRWQHYKYLRGYYYYYAK